MALHKNINGKQIQLSKEEEGQLRFKWKENDDKNLTEKTEEATKAERKSALQSSLNKKLLGLGFTSDEIDLLY